MLAARETRAYAWSVRHEAHHLRAAELVAQHTSPLAGGWEPAVEIASHHSEMLNELVGGREPPFHPTLQSCQSRPTGLALYTEILGAGARGMFDADAHLFRGLVDCSGLVFALAAAPVGLRLFLAESQAWRPKGAGSR